MTVDQAVARLVLCMSDGDAFHVLDAYVQRRVKRLVDRADWREDIAQDVLLKLLERMDRGSLHIEVGAKAYISQAIRNTAIDRGRRQRKATEVHAQLEAQQRQRGAVEPPWGATMDDPRTLVAKVHAWARAQRPPQHRSAFDQDLAQVMALVFTGRSMTEIVCEAAGILAEDAGYRTAANRVYKRHSRLRETLLRAGAHMTDQGLLDEEEARLLPLLLAQMVRCQRSAREGSVLRDCQQGADRAVPGATPDAGHSGAPSGSRHPASPDLEDPS